MDITLETTLEAVVLKSIVTSAVVENVGSEAR
jgi:hypothetical protein